MKGSTGSPDIRESGLVRSGQAGMHPRLDAIVRRHLAAPWSQPLHRPSVDTWCELAESGVLGAARPLVLDSGCGTGDSTRRLAGLYPGHLVIGVDRSQKRLDMVGPTSLTVQGENCILLRSELATFWRLLLANGHSPERHFLLYPNPWPKAGHLMRRWHGHPVFPLLLALGGELEMRCNWEIYAREFARAAGIATGGTIAVKRIVPETAVSPFERKYLERGQALYSVRVPANVTRQFSLARSGR